MLGIEGYKEIYVEFKWADADVQINEMEDFYSYGDAAPGGRLNHVYQNYIPGVSRVTYDTYTADDTALEAAIAEAETVDAAGYTPDTYAAYADAVAAGEFYVDNPKATQAEVDAALAVIQAAKSALKAVNTADKTALEAAVAEAGGVNAADYTAASYKVYADAVAAGRVVLDDPDATQSEIDSAAAAILAAKAGLTVDKTALEAAVAEAGGANAADYTAASYKAYADAVAAGKAVLDDPDATQSEIDGAIAAIAEAHGKLVKAADKSALQAAVDNFATVDGSLYTEESYKAYADAVAVGEEVLADGDATDSAVAAALAAILEALEKLELLPPEAERIEGLTSAGFQVTSVYDGKTARLAAVTLRSANITDIAIFDEAGNRVTYSKITEAPLNRRKPTQRIFYIDMTLVGSGTHTYTVYGVDENGNLTLDYDVCSIKVK
jgi:hypothetical protein